MIGNADPIGIFDSGVGGLTVMRAVADLLPHENLIYLGDTARVPYGNRGPDTVRRYSLNAGNFLTNHGIKALVVACNTATAFGLDALIESLDVPVIGVVEPVSIAASEHTQTGHIGVVGTRGTVRSQVYPKSIQKLGRPVHVVQQACPLFVPLAEEGWVDGEVTESIAASYLEAFAGSQIDTLILGCTHYPILRDCLQKVTNQVVGRDVTLLDSATATAQAVKVRLAKLGLQNAKTDTVGWRRFLATDEPEQFASSAGRFFGSELDDIQHVDLPGATT